MKNSEEITWGVDMNRRWY